MREDFPGFTTQQHRGQAFAAVRSHDDEIARPCLGRLDDPLGGILVLDVQRVAGSDQDGDTLIFSYESRTLKPGTVLWDHSQANSSKSSIQNLDSFQTFLAQLTIESILLMMFALLFALHTRNHQYVRHNERS